MIISRTPFRVSFFGGGTDYPAWFQNNPGAVLCSSINKYCYISCRTLPPFFEHKIQVAWSKIERVKDRMEIQHPSVRETLGFFNEDDGIEIHTDGDLPARSGLGSSSAFTVGLTNALYAYRGTMPTKMQLALDAIHIEQERLKENVGCQDQVIAAFGGLNHITFAAGPKGPALKVAPIICKPQRLAFFQDHLMLMFTGLSRTASEIAEEQIQKTAVNGKALEAMLHMVEEGMSILTGTGSLDEFGKLLHESWLLKKSLSSQISNSSIDQMYAAARKAGAIGGKILGAGGGGFMLLFARPEHHNAIKDALKDYLHVPFRFENQGSQIIFYEQGDDHQAAFEARKDQIQLEAKK